METNAVNAQCPYCGEPIELYVDETEVEQIYIEDCAVCCRPIQVQPFIDFSGNVSARLYHENEVPGA